MSNKKPINIIVQHETARQLYHHCDRRLRHLYQLIYASLPKTPYTYQVCIEALNRIHQALSLSSQEVHDHLSDLDKNQPYH